MTETDFSSLERSLSVILPERYPCLMAAYPFDEYSPPVQAYVPDNVASVFGLNKQIRDDGVFANAWQDRFFAMGTSWAGDAFFLDTGVDDSPVFKVTQQNNVVSKVSDSLDAWFAKLSEWYVQFDHKSVAEEYSALAAAVHTAGFFTNPPEPCDGWHRITIASKRRPQGGLTGNSFWVSITASSWFAGAWGGHVYRVHGDISEFCVGWLRRVPDGTRADFDQEIRAQFMLELLPGEAFKEITETSER